MATVKQSSSSRGYSRKNRVYKFHSFLLETYSDLLSGSGSSKDRTVVLDVAGGKGTLSWLLQNCDNVDSIVVDPRISKYESLMRSVEYLNAHPEVLDERSDEIRRPEKYQPLAFLKSEGRLPVSEGFVTPPHLRLLVDKALVVAVENYLQTRDYKEWQKYFTGALSNAKEANTLGHREIETRDSKYSSSPTTDAYQALRMILSTKLVVGFHPDQATEASIDLALLLGIPFSVVPCCVFPAQFPNRYLQGTKQHVNSYPLLIKYLRRKVGMVKSALLDFPSETSKNLVLFTTSLDYRCHEIENDNGTS